MPRSNGTYSAPTSGFNPAVAGETMSSADWNALLTDIELALTKSVAIDSSGNVGIGITAPDGTLHVMTASAGAVTAFASGSDLVVENNTHAGISILAPDASDANIIFGSPTDNLAAFLQWNYNSGLLTLASAKSGGQIAFNTSNNIEAMRLDNSGNVGIGTTVPDGPLHIFSGTGAGAVTADSNADDLVVEGSANTGISILSADGSQSRIQFGSVTDNAAGLIRYYEGDNTFLLGSTTPSGTTAFVAGNGVERMRLDSDGALLVGDFTNANMTQGLTINQGASDDEILAFKSSDVAHGMTTITETDTYGYFQKLSPTAGGLFLHGLTEDVSGLTLEADSTTVDATSTTATRGNIILRGYKKSGTSVTAMLANEALLTVESAALTRFLIQGDGAIHATNVTGGQLDGTALDAEDDIALVRAFERTVHNGMGIAMTKWDEQIAANAEDLKRIGVLSSEGDFYNMQRMNSLLGGAIWQSHVRQKELEERLEVAEAKLKLIETVQ